MRYFNNSIALVIGINAYGHGIPPLRSAVPDARRLAEVLASQHSYDAIVLEDVTLTEIRSVLVEELPAKLTGNDRLLVYFAGHGLSLDGAVGPQGFLVPRDAVRDDPT